MDSDQQTLRNLLTTQARRFEKKIFLTGGNQSYSFRAVDDWTDRTATGLNRLGLRPGDRMALLLSNRPEFMFLFLGAAKMGIVTVPLDPSLPDEEILFVIGHSDALTLVTEERFAGRAQALREKGSRLERLIVVDAKSSATVSFEGLTQGTVLGFWPDLHPDDVAAIVYSRRGQDAPRGAILTHQNFVSMCKQTIQPLRINDTDRFFSGFSLADLNAFVLLVLTPWAAGAGTFLHSTPSPQTIFEALHQHHITVLGASGQECAALVELAEKQVHDLSSLRLVVCPSSLVDSETLRAFEEQYDALIVTAYSLVEACGVTCANPYTGVRKPSSVGLPLPGQECRVVDQHGRDASPGQVGEILVRGPNVMKGYYKDLDASAKALREGWLHTGDFGYVDADGYYYLVNR